MALFGQIDGSLRANHSAAHDHDLSADLRMAVQDGEGIDHIFPIDSRNRRDHGFGTDRRDHGIVSPGLHHLRRQFLADNRNLQLLDLVNLIIDQMPDIFLKFRRGSLMEITAQFSLLIDGHVMAFQL